MQMQEKHFHVYFCVYLLSLGNTPVLYC